LIEADVTRFEVVPSHFSKWTAERNAKPRSVNAVSWRAG